MTGDWWDAVADGIRLMFWLAVAGVVLVPLLVAALIALVVFR